MKGGAQFSSDRQHRYALWRTWGDGKWCAFIGLNPSTADENQDDPTIRRCITFARSWEHGGLLMLNMYAYRATQPAEMWKAQGRGVNIIGPENYFEDLLKQMSQPIISRVVAAWGTHASERGRVLGYEASKQVIKIDCLMKTKNGDPQHPLYLPSGLLPEPWNYEPEDHEKTATT